MVVTVCLQALRFRGPAFINIKNKIYRYIIRFWFIPKINFLKKTITYLVCITILVIACSKSNDAGTPVDCSGATKMFSTDVNPIIQSYCASNSGCHASGSTNGPGALTTYLQIYNASSSIRAAVANGSMPQNSSLSVSQKSAIICWIDNGAINN
jgi:hypothetical protein